MGSEKRADQAWDFLSNWFTSGFLWVAVTLPAVPGRGFGALDALFWAATGRRWRELPSGAPPKGVRPVQYSASR